MEFLRDVVEWIDRYPSAAMWVQGLGTMLAAFIALVAAAFAFAAAKQQGNAIRETAIRAELEHQRALAAAFWAELNDRRVKILSIQKNLRVTKVRLPSMLPVSPLDTPIFDGNTSEVGKLGSELSWAVVQAYALIRDNDRKFKGLLESRSEGMADDYPSNLGSSLDAVIVVLDKTLSKLAAIAKLDKTVAPIAENALDAIRGHDQGS